MSEINRLAEEIVIDAPADFKQLPKVYVGRMSGATPSVKNITRFKGVNTGAVTVTQFKNGSDGQTIRIVGDGQMTITNGANIKTNTGANKLLAVNKCYVFTLFSNVWIEDA